MDLIQAFILGIVQGLTEFLPISSTGHLRILPALLGWKDPGAAFTAVIQLGTLVAVLIYFRQDLTRAFLGWCRSLYDPEARGTLESKMGWGILIGTLPIVVFGVLFKDRIEQDLRSLYVIAWTLIGMGLLMSFAEVWGARRPRREMDSVTVKDGLWVGLWQAVALIPGASRSGSTITGALFAGLDRPAAARFSFLLSVPAILAAAIFSIREHQAAMLENLPAVVVANLAALVSGYAAIAFLISYLQKRGTLVFTVYRVLLGVILLGLLISGRLDPMVGL